MEYVTNLRPLEEVRLQVVSTVSEVGDTSRSQEKHVRFDINELEGVDLEEASEKWMRGQYADKPCQVRDPETHPAADAAREELL